jgi:uncharacterized repeat protein (TIGR03803 family)
VKPARVMYTNCCLLAVLAFFLFAEPGWAKEVKVLYTFQGGADGTWPWGPLVRDKHGNFYGTTHSGGAYGLEKYGGFGTVFELSHTVEGWTKTTIYSFKDRSDGFWPGSGLVIDEDGNLYGTTLGSGNSCECGLIFELSPSATGWTKKTLHVLNNDEGLENYGGGLAIDSAGNLYGTTGLGGPYGYGAVYELSPSGTKWIETTLHPFRQEDGAAPYAPVSLDQEGNLYGTASTGGPNGAGIVYELVRSSGWSETILFGFAFGSFADGQNGLEGLTGEIPYSGVTFDQAGNLYGTTVYGDEDEVGLVYELSPSDTGWTETVLHDFSFGDGAFPIAGVTVDPSTGNLYGAASEGGGGACVGNGCGTLFELSPAGSTWTESTLHNFTGVEGDTPLTNLFLDHEHLYGVTSQGGIYGAGVVFEISP